MKLSVITINYNNRDGLRKTVESVINQTSTQYEYIVIDGGSTDGSVDVIKEYTDKIDYWVSEPDKGIYNAMNKGIAVAKGEYCIFLNSGDWFYDNKILSLIFPHLDGTDVVAGHLKLDTDGIWYAPEEVTMSMLYGGKTLSHPATFIKTSLLKRYYYDESYKIVSDWKFFIQIFIYDNASYKPINLIISMFDTNGISSTNKNLCTDETFCVLKNDFNHRVYDYYLSHSIDDDGRLYNIIRQTKYRKIVYSFIVVIFKFIMIFKRNSWIHGFPLNLHNKR